METELRSKAEFELSKSIIKLLRLEPFYAHILVNLTRKIDEGIPTMAVSFTDDQVNLHVNPNFLLEKLSENQRVGVLKHEVLHIIFKHLFRGNSGNTFLENLAADIVVNQFVKPWPLTEGAVYLTTFPELNLQANQTLEYYYNELKKLQTNSAKTEFPVSCQNLKKLQSECYKSNGCHDLWSNEGKDILSRLVNKVVKSSKDKIDINSWGTLPSEIKNVIELITTPSVLNWKNLLRIFSTSCGRTTLRATHRKESKRFEGSEGTKIKRLRKIVVAIDTSGSIDSELLSNFWKEIMAIHKSGTEIVVVQCDAAIHSVTEFRKTVNPPTIVGGGGTSFDPVFIWLKKNRRYNGLIYFTDGYASMPKHKISIPVLWCVYGPINDLTHLPGKVIAIK